MSDAHNYLMSVHRQACFESGDHPEEVDTPYSLGADAIIRADLPATNAQAMANPKVQALVEAARAQLLYMDMCGDTGDLERDLRAALAAFESDT